MTPDDAARETPDPEAARRRLLDQLQVTFGDPTRFSQALTHSSHTQENELDALLCNERLEFLGDSVVQLAVSEYLFRTNPNVHEGGLTTRRAAVVRGLSLAQAARRIGLGEALVLGRGCEGGGGRARRSVLACGFEAVIGAIYVDQGWEVARECVIRLLAENLEEAAGAASNAKGELQELAQERYHQTPEYRQAGAFGKPHERRFRIEVWVGDRRLGSGEAQSKKEAGQLAAAQALAALRDEPAT